MINKLLFASTLIIIAVLSLMSYMRWDEYRTVKQLEQRTAITQESHIINETNMQLKQVEAEKARLLIECEQGLLIYDLLTEEQQTLSTKPLCTPIPLIPVSL